MGGFIGHGRGVDKIDEIPFVSLHVRCGRTGCAAVSRGCLLRSLESVSPIVVERRGHLAVPARLHKLFSLISGVLTPSVSVSTEG